MVKDPVVKCFPEFSRVFEGCCTYMYCDVRGLLTTGIGFLIDQNPAAVPWRCVDGSPASDQQIRQAAQLCRDRFHSAPPKTLYGSVEYMNLTTLRLTESSIRGECLTRMYQHAQMLEGLVSLSKLPAAAQLAMLSLSWAIGPAGIATQFPRLLTAIARQDWKTAAKENQLSTIGNPGVGRRNVANAILIDQANHRDPEQINWTCFLHFLPATLAPWSAPQ